MEIRVATVDARSHQWGLIQSKWHPEQFVEEYNHWKNMVESLRKNWAKLEEGVRSQFNGTETNVEGINQLLNTYRADIQAYLQTVEPVLRADPPVASKPSSLPAVRQRLINATEDGLLLKLGAVAQTLTHLKQEEHQKAKIAEAKLEQAETLRVQIVFFSMLLSGAIASIVAVLTTIAITRPLKRLTHVAERVTQESNFDLQATVTATDEIGVLAMALNDLIHKVKHLLEQQKAEATRQLLQSEKMSSLGRMLAGVAHEINNPVNFIYGNMEHVRGYTQDLLDLLETYGDAMPHPAIAVQEKMDDIDLDFLKEDLDKILLSMQIGAERVRQIVLSLKNFSRLDEVQAHPVDLHNCIESTLLILNNRIKRGVTVTQLYGEVPTIEGYPGSLYQVFMNIFSNALDAMEEKQKTLAGRGNAAHLSSFQPEIIITTERLDQQVLVRITDNGPGIAPTHQTQIFESFFTTKPIGVGTGLGLSISRQIVEEKHHGQLSCQSTVGEGTTFAIALPIQQPAEVAPADQSVVLVQR